MERYHKMKNFIITEQQKNDLIRFAENQLLTKFGIGIIQLMDSLPEIDVDKVQEHKEDQN